MVKVKHFLEAVENDDGQRIWVEPLGLTKDLQEWCKVDHVVPHLGPPKKLWDWFDRHHDGYDHFRGRYHETLSRSRYRPALQQLVYVARKENITLLHGDDDAEHNSAVALHEFISELEAYCPDEGEK